jgi:hypothetical protein
MCCQHIAENIHKRFGREYRTPFWQIARAQSETAFDSAVQALKRDAPRVEEYLSSIGYNTFTYVHFLLPRFGHDTSNIVESTNSMWYELRELPPLQLLNRIYQWYTTAYFERIHLLLDPGNLVLSNKAYRSYKYRESIARGFQVLLSSNINFLVTTLQGVDFIIDLPNAEELDSRQNLLTGRCTCGKYYEYTAPCVHAIACIQFIGGDLYRYFYPYYYQRAYNNTYCYPVPPVTIQGLQIQEDNQILPPIKRAKRGRPKVARIRANYREEDSSQRRAYTCSVCKQAGHSRRVCPNQPVEHGRAQRAQDQLIIDDTDEGKCTLL